MGNMFLGANMESQWTIALGIARVNHSCKPNAATIYDETAHVAILFAQKDIQPGEVISLCLYSPFFKLDASNQNVPDMNPEWSLEDELSFVENRVLFLTCGIACSADAEKTVLPNGQLLQIFVIGIAGKTMTLSVESSESILDIKSKILDKTGNNKTHFYFRLLFIKIL